MSWLKRNFVSEAFGEIGFESDFDLPAEQLQGGLRKLDALMASLNGDGIRLGYPIPSTADGGNLDEDAGVPDWANQAIVALLAVKLASKIGRTVSTQLQLDATRGYAALLARAAAAAIPEVQMPRGSLAGAGNTRARAGRIFLDPPTDKLDIGSDTDPGFDVEE